MNEIDDLYDKINLEVTKSYEIKHEKLIKEENNLKENLQNKVTKIKEKLEEYSTESNRIIKIYERINKGIDKLEKEEKSMLKILSYVSQMNKNQKETKNILSILMRNENYNEKFKIVYEDKGTECLVKDLEDNTDYEIRICTYCDDLIGKWSDIHKVKTSVIDSKILRSSGDEKKYLSKIFEWTGYKRMDLLYRGSRDGTTSKIFHERCDHKGPTICLYQNEKGYIFGGFASISWTSDGNTHEAKNSILFTLTNIHGTAPMKFLNKDSSNVNHHPSRGPCFGNYNDIAVFHDYSSTNCDSAFPCNYSDSLGKGKSIFTGDFNNNNSNFKMAEIEIFKVY